MQTQQVYIGGKWVRHTGDQNPIDVFNPATGELIARVPECSLDDVTAAVDAARSAQGPWAATPPAERARLLRRVAERVREREAELVAAAVADIGCSARVAQAMTVGAPQTTFENVAQIVEEYTWQVESPGQILQRVPLGVVAAITPWNYPLHQIAAKLAPAFGAGNTVVLKASEVAPTTAWLFAEILHESGLPAGVFNLVSGFGPTVGEALVRDPGVDMVTFTGSLRAGEQIGALCGAQIKRCTLELGGKSAAIVTPDGELAKAVNSVINAIASNSGQTCSALTRVFVPADRLAEAESLALEAAARIVIGNPADTEVHMGPVVSAKQQQQVLEYIASGEAEGARRITLAALPDNLGEGAFVPLTVFSDVTAEMRIAQEEIFGPVVCLMAYEHIEEAIAQANDSDYGLAAAVWAADREAGIAIASRLEVGQVRVNGGRFSLTAPFGGFKKSGIGRELGPVGFEEFLEHRVLFV